MPYNRLVKQAGYGPKAHTQLLTALHQLQTVFVEKGVHIQTLQAAILASKGNVSPVLHLSIDQQTAQTQWLSHDPDWLALTQRLSGRLGRSSLGATAVADSSSSPVMAIIKLALPLLNLIMSKLLHVKINDPDDPVPVPEEEADEQETDAPNEPDSSTGSSDSSGTNDTTDTESLGRLRSQLRNHYFRPRE